MNKEELKKYFSEQMDNAEKHQIEQSSQLDPFAYEAMEGYESMGLSESDLKLLDERLEKRVFGEAKKSAVNWWKISGMAASIGLVLGLFGGWLLFGLKDELNPKTVSQKMEDTNTPKEQTPLPVDQIAVLDKAKPIDVPSSAHEVEQKVAPPSPTNTITNTTSADVAESEAAEISEPVANKLSDTRIAASEKKVDTKEIESNLASRSEAPTTNIEKERKKEIQPASLVAVTKPVAAPKSSLTVAEKSTATSPSKAKTKSMQVKDEAPYKKIGEEISLGGLADMLKEERVVEDKTIKADGLVAPSMTNTDSYRDDAPKKAEPYKYDYDKAEQTKSKNKSDDMARGKKSKIQIPLDALPVNITFEDYVKIKMRDKSFRCPKKGSVKLIVNLDKNKKIEDFTIFEMNNKICVDYAKAILEEWISEKASLYDGGTAYQFVVNFP
jgi:hypothetical protein